MNWSNVTCTIGGVPFPIEDVSVEGVVTDTVQRFSHGAYTAECTMHVEGDAARSIWDFFRPRTRGASDSTLAKRVGYGGRKGQSAWRRLRAKGFVGTLHITDFPPMPLPPFRVTTRAPQNESSPTKP